MRGTSVMKVLMKDFDFECEDGKNFIEEAIVANVIKSVIFNGKVVYRIVRTDSVGDNAIFIPETQEIDCHDEETIATVTIENTQISLEHQRSSNDNISGILEKFCTSVESIDKRFLKIKDHLIGLSYSKLTTNSSSRNGTRDNFYTELLKIRISELERQLSERNAITEFLSTRIIAKPSDNLLDKWQ